MWCDLELGVAGLWIYTPSSLVPINVNVGGILFRRNENE